MRVGSHLFILLPYCIRMFALKTPRVDRLAVKIMYPSVVRVENHWFIMPRIIYRAHTIVWL